MNTKYTEAHAVEESGIIKDSLEHMLVLKTMMLSVTDQMND